MTEKNKGGRPSNEEVDAKFQREKAEMKERNLKKRKANQAKNLARNKTKGKITKSGATSRAEKLNVVLTQILDILIKESVLTPNFTSTDVESVKRRKAELSNVKDLLVITKQMTELMHNVRSDESADVEANTTTAENVTMLDDVREQLAARGIKADI